MKKIFDIFLIATLTFLCLSAQAALQYRNRFPFNQNIGSSDVLVASYNFSGKSGVSCEASDPKVKIEFMYKGREKSADLPITLQASLPTNPSQELADISGRLHIFAVDHLDKSNKEITVSCHYLDKGKSS